VSASLEGILFSFSFHRIYGGKGIKYFVQAIDGHRNKHSFTMEASGGRWKIINAPKVIDLIVRNEAMLSQIISKYKSD